MRNSSQAITRRLLDPTFGQLMMGRLTLTLIVSMIVNVGLAISLFVAITHPPRVKHIYHDPFGKPRELIVTDQPYFTDAQVTNWSVEKVTGLYTINFLQYAQQLSSYAQYFTTPAWNTWLDAFKKPGNIEFIKSRRVMLTASLKSAGSVRWEGITPRGDYEWHVYFPMYLKWENGSGSKTDLLAVNVIIRRTNDPLHPDGLVIAELNAPRASDGGD
ncbi:DotI/IcmL/TraM family protein [Komagataeibacter sp. FNDCR2]|uniref:DotI/IcmL/TraM family protein n=1 Tax=Komagataeibacter sp. FNDCR2 TaxID=2878682 RepID=UPI001E3011C8|nr:DotI/IcmL/TraM family protein [Komagataeibacter sp. FNDCR2]MCE2576675.1 DotI/IcmL family type IV secretion protein [Komagataeibacter sp. FNDCR2]